MSEEKIIYESSIKFPTENFYGDFERHLDRKNNKRVIFSGKFGTGKTTFLKDYFDKHKNRYLNIRINPIFYSVSKNEDIFELIKFDLLSQILDNTDFGINESEMKDICKKLLEILKKTGLIVLDKLPNIFSVVTPLAGPLSPFVSFILGSVTQVTRHFVENPASLTNKDTVNSYLNSIISQKGSPYERDSITDIIRQLIGKAKINKNNADTVLIIDDLDRLDPEHIFRLLNVFSAQYNPESDDNKFGFDKIILVCDLNNIREIYKYKYGPNVDFLGYINKFYSINPYIFNVGDLLINSVDNFLPIISNPNILNESEYSFCINHSIIIHFISIISHANLLNFRMLLNNSLYESCLDVFTNWYKKKIPYKVSFLSSQYFLGNFHWILILLNVLFKGNVHDTLKLLYRHYEKVNSFNDFIGNDIHGKIITSCIPWLDIVKFKRVYNSPSVSPPEGESIGGSILGYNLLFKFESDQSDSKKRSIRFIRGESLGTGTNKNILDSYVNPFEVLLKTYEYCIDNGIYPNDNKM